MGDIFGRTFACPCGRTHSVRPDEIVYAADAMDRLADVCGRCTPGRRVAVLMDVRTRAAAGGAAATKLAAAGWDVREVIVPDPPSAVAADRPDPICDDATKAVLAPRVAGADLIVAVGAGVISDLGKWLAFESPGGGLPLVTFATAASMNGYASANVAATVGGLKVLFQARPPAAVLADPRVLAAAPYELTAAGLGDVMAKPVSSADWFLNHCLFNDYYCRASVELIAELERLYLDRPRDLAARRPEAVHALFEALLLTGAAMTMAESSAPASGGEHLISHSLDTMSHLDGRPHDLHGRQVGLATVLTAELFNRAIAVESPALAEPRGDIDRAFWGPLAGAVADEYARKLPRLRAARELLARGGAWDSLRSRLVGMLRRPGEIRDSLAAAGAACAAEHIRCDRPRLAAAFLHAHEIRSRFTVLDLAWLLGLLPRAAGEIADAWA